MSRLLALSFCLSVAAFAMEPFRLGFRTAMPRQQAQLDGELAILRGVCEFGAVAFADQKLWKGNSRLSGAPAWQSAER